MAKKIISSFYLHLILLALAGLALVFFLSTRFGPGVSTDSVNYIAVAENLAAGNGFISFNGGIFLLWPPLHPILLALPRLLFDIDPVRTGGTLNGLAFGAAIFLSGAVLYQYTGKKLWGYLGALIVLFSTSLIGLTLNLGSDPLFINLVLLFLIFILRYYHRQDGFSLVAMIVIALMACLQRYIGVSLVLTGGFAILYTHRANIKRGLGLAALFGILTLVPLGIWFARNIALTGTLIGTRNPSEWKLLENAADGLLKMSHWFLPFIITTSPIFLVLLGVAIGFFLGSRNRQTHRNLIVAYKRPASILMLAWLVIYLGSVLVLIKSEDHRLLYDDRYYMPIFIPVFYFIFVFLDEAILPILSTRGKRLGTAILVGLFLLWLVFPAYSMVKFGRQLMRAGGVPVYNLYNLPRFRDSDVTQNLETYLEGQNPRVYSNYSAAVYLFTRLEAHGPPSKRDFYGDQIGLRSYEGHWPRSTPAVLIWYEPNHKKHLFLPDRLGNLASLNALYQSEGGAIYTVENFSQITE